MHLILNNYKYIWYYIGWTKVFWRVHVTPALIVSVVLCVLYLTIVSFCWPRSCLSSDISVCPFGIFELLLIFWGFLLPSPKWDEQAHSTLVVRSASYLFLLFHPNLIQKFIDDVSLVSSIIYLVVAVIHVKHSFKWFYMNHMYICKKSKFLQE